MRVLLCRSEIKRVSAPGERVWQNSSDIKEFSASLQYFHKLEYKPRVVVLEAPFHSISLDC